MYKRNNKIYFNICNICKSKNIENVINLGYHMPADTFINKKDFNIFIPKTRLVCKFCSNCLNIQLSNTLSKQLIYNKFKYSYRSGNSLISRKYWKQYHSYIKKIIKIEKGNILEVGSNDGYLINQFNKKYFKLYAYEISKEMHTGLKKLKINSKNYAFEDIPKKELISNKNKFDIIISNNVLNHCHNISNFFKNVYSLLSPNGYFFLEVPYSPWMLINNKFELIYLEHINYFSLLGLNKVSNTNNLYINKVDFFDYHGKMIRLLISKNPSKNTKMHNIILKEKKFFKSKSVFFNFSENIKQKKEIFLKKINTIKQDDQSKIVGVGAGAKTSSFLNFFDLNTKHIDFLTDNSKFKIGKYIPLSKIQIKSDLYLKDKKNIYVFFPTWNISNFLKRKIRKLNKHIKFIKY